MTKTSKPTGNTLVAAKDIAIERRHFDAGEPIEGVSKEQLDIAVKLKRVVKASDYKGPAWPRPAAVESDQAPDA